MLLGTMNITFFVRIRDVCWSLRFFSALQKAVQKSHGVFVEGTRVMLISGLAYKKYPLQKLTTVVLQIKPQKHVYYSYIMVTTN